MNQREHGEVLAERLNGVADDGHVAAPGADKRGVGTGGEHFRQTVLAEAMAALKQKRDSFFFVVARLADRTARHFHRQLKSIEIGRFSRARLSSEEEEDVGSKTKKEEAWKW